MLRQLRYLLLIFLTATTGAVHAQDVLPRPEKPLAGKIRLTYKDAEPVKPKLKVPSTFRLQDAPNILLVLIDDCGYGQMSTFGGGIPTPAMVWRRTKLLEWHCS